MARVAPPIDKINDFLYPDLRTDFGLEPKRVYTRVKGKFVGIGWTGRASRMMVKPDGGITIFVGGSREFVVLDSQLD